MKGTMTAAFEKVGVRKEITEFDSAIAKFLNNGGTIQEARLRVEIAAEKLAAGGHANSASTGQGDVATQTSPDTGLGKRAENGHDHPAQQGEPSKTQKQAAVSVAKKSATALLKKYGWIGDCAMPAGPSYRDMRNGEAVAFLKRQIREGVNHGRSAVVLARIAAELEKLGQVDPQAKVFDTLPPKTIKQISHETEMEVIGPMARGWLEGFVNQSTLAISQETANG